MATAAKTTTKTDSTKKAAARADVTTANNLPAASEQPQQQQSKPKVESFNIAESANTLDLAKDLAKFIKDNKLSTTVQGKEFVNVEGWQYAGSRLGIVPIIDHVINVSTEQEMKYQAKVTLFDLRSSQTVGGGYAVCSNKESGKKFYQEFAIMSMAQTRAVGKSYRNLLAWIIRAAGYEPTPAEEMDYNTNVPRLAAPKHALPAAPPQRAASEAAAEEEMYTANPTTGSADANSSALPVASAGSVQSHVEIQRARILAATSSLELKEIWEGLTGGERKALQADKDAAKQRIEAAVKEAASTPIASPVMQILPSSITTPTNRPEEEGGEAIPYATASQKEDVIRLINHPVITRQEKTKILLNINRLTEYPFKDKADAPALIGKLRKMIDDRENATTGPEWADQLKGVLKSAETAEGLGTPLMNAEDIARLRKVAYDRNSTPNQLRDALFEARELVRAGAVAAA